MGFGQLINAKAQDNLADLQKNVNTIGANIQQYAANQAAEADMAQANLAIEQAGLNAEEAAIQMYTEIGRTSEAFAAEGVEQTGSPLDQINQIRMLGQQQIAAIQKAGMVQAQYYQTQANIAQTQGLAQVLSAQGQNLITDQQNKLSQAQQKNALLASIINPIAGLGVGLLGAI